MKAWEFQKEKADKIAEACYYFSRQLKKLVPALNDSQEFSVSMNEIKEIAIYTLDSCGDKYKHEQLDQ